MTLTLEEKRAKLAAGRPVRCEAHPLLKLRRHPFTIAAQNVARQDERNTSPVFRGTVGEQGEWVHGCRLCWLDEQTEVRREIQRRRRLAAWRGREAEANAHEFLPPAPSIENAAPQHARYVNRDDDTAAMAEDDPYGDPPRYPLREPEVHVAEWPAVDTRDAFTRWLHEGRPDRYAALVALRELDGMMRDYGADRLTQQAALSQNLVDLPMPAESYSYDAARALVDTVRRPIPITRTPRTVDDDETEP